MSKAGQKKKPTYKDIEAQLIQFAKILNQLSNLYMIMESDVREIKEALLKADILKAPEVPEAAMPEEAKVEDYFPKKEELPQE